MSIAIIATVWGDYWEKFGSQFVESLENLNTQPDEVFISSPEPLNLPKHWIEVIQPLHKWNCWNDLMLMAESDWLVPVGMDDIWFPDGLDGLSDVEDDVDIQNLACWDSGRIWAADPQGFEHILHSNHNPMLGAIAIRRSVVEQILFRETIWCDWIQWMEIRKLGLKVKFRTSPLLLDHIRHPDAYSIRGNANGDLEVEQMRAILREHNVVPGIEFPPQILK
jgi:hypothetical protein